MKPITLSILLTLVTSPAQAQWQVQQTKDSMTDVTYMSAWIVDATGRLDVTFSCAEGVIGFELTTLRRMDWLHSAFDNHVVLDFRAGTDSMRSISLVQTSSNGLHEAYTTISDSPTEWQLLEAFMGKQGVLLRIRLVGGEEIMTRVAPDSVAVGKVKTACKK